MGRFSGYWLSPDGKRTRLPGVGHQRPRAVHHRRPDEPGGEARELSLPAAGQGQREGEAVRRRRGRRPRRRGEVGRGGVPVPRHGEVAEDGPAHPGGAEPRADEGAGAGGRRARHDEGAAHRRRRGVAQPRPGVSPLARGRLGLSLAHRTQRRSRGGAAQTGWRARSGVGEGRCGLRSLRGAGRADEDALLRRWAEPGAPRAVQREAGREARAAEARGPGGHRAAHLLRARRTCWWTGRRASTRCRGPRCSRCRARRWSGWPSCRAWPKSRS